MKRTNSLYTVFFCTIQLVFFQYVTAQSSNDFIIAFGSCNKQGNPQTFWKEILKNTPNLFIWGGDNIYTVSGDMIKAKNSYTRQNNNSDYKKIKKSASVMATWNDHDYGKKDAGVEWSKKDESQQLFLDFLEIPKDDPKRTQKGVYNSKIFEIEKGSIKVVILDTRYFRSPLKKSKGENGLYIPHDNGEGSILGKEQWKWFEKELESNYSDFVIIVSSIQFLSSEHGFETWGNFPHEIERLKSVLINKGVRNAIFLSGDREISEFSMAKVKGLRYPLLDFTSSGLTHSYADYKGESNKYRVGHVISVPSFGVLKFDLNSYAVTMQIRGENNIVLQEFIRQYPKN